MNGPESNNLPPCGRGIGFAATCIANSKKRNWHGTAGSFSKINERNSFISVGCEFGGIMQMNDLLNDKFNTQNDSGCG